MTLLVLATHPIQYHAPVYREIQTRFGLPVTVIYASDFSVIGYRDLGFGTEFSWDTDLLSGYTSVFLSRVAQGGAESDRSVSAKGIGKLIHEINPQAILITGYRPRFDLRAFANAMREGCPLIFRAETLDTVQTQKNALKRLPRDTFLRWFYRQFDHLLYIGENSHRHYLRLGVGEAKLAFSPYCVDISPFKTDEVERNHMRSYSRDQLQIGSEQFVIIVCGKLIPRKSPDLVLQAVKQLPQDLRSRIVVLFLGEGEMKDYLTQISSDSPQISTRFVGFQNQKQLSLYYHAGDILVLASQLEPWGLVVNEALHHGLPCVVSSHVGCAPDLVRPDITGYCFKYGDTEDLAQSIIQTLTLSQNPHTRSNCREVASLYSVQSAAAGIVDVYNKSLVARAH